MGLSPMPFSIQNSEKNCKILQILKYLTESGLDKGLDLRLFTAELSQSSLTSLLKDYTAWRLHLHLQKKSSSTWEDAA